MSALQLSRARDVEYGAAFALALSGASSRVQILINDLSKRFPEDTFVQVDYLPTLRALLAVKRNAPSYALEEMESADRYELATAGYWFGFFGNLYPTYLCGTAYLAKHEGAKAATEFQKILGHKSIVFGDPIGALARLQLGRALMLAGDTRKAKTAYQNFLTLWKDGDPDIPILKQAKWNTGSCSR